MIQFDNNNKFDRQHPLGAQKNLIEMAIEMKKKWKVYARYAIMVSFVIDVYTQ